MSSLEVELRSASASIINSLFSSVVLVNLFYNSSLSIRIGFFMSKERPTVVKSFLFFYWANGVIANYIINPIF